jgi:8-oxo-dGTP diphosphatase
MSQLPPEPTIRKHGAVAVIRRGNHWLMIRRSIHVRAPRKLCFPGGTIEQGEAEIDAVARELFEELGVEVTPSHCVWRSVTSWGVALSWWWVEWPQDAAPAPNPTEVEDVLWMEAEAAMSHDDLLESAKHFFEALLRGEVSLASSS